jgi:hypothetical protein
MSGLKSTKKHVETEVYTENDYISEPFEINPDHDLWLAINSLRNLLDIGMFSDHKDMDWRLNDMVARLEGFLDEQ